jgi:hypothetical protein
MTRGESEAAIEKSPTRRCGSQRTAHVRRHAPWWFVPVHAVLPRRAREAIRRMIGYARLEPI